MADQPTPDKPADAPDAPAARTTDPPKPQPTDASQPPAAADSPRPWTPPDGAAASPAAQAAQPVAAQAAQPVAAQAAQPVAARAGEPAKAAAAAAGTPPHAGPAHAAGAPPHARPGPAPVSGAPGQAAPGLRTPAVPGAMVAPGAPGAPGVQQGWPALPTGWRPPPPPVPRQPSAFVRRWPGPTGPASRLVLAGAAASGLVAAATVPLGNTGIGWVIPAVVGAAFLAAIAKAAGTPVGVARIGWSLAAIALLAAGALRAADWLFALCLLTVPVAISLAAAGGRSFVGLVAGAVAWPAGVLRSLPWMARGLAALRQARAASAVRALVAVGVTLFLLLVFGALLAGADEGFARVMDAVTPDLSVTSVPKWIFLFVSVTLGLLGAAYLASAPPDLAGLEQPGRRRLRMLEWALPIAALDVLFGIFVAVQFTVLFGGVNHVLGPDGPTFAEYARKGFWQLLAVTVLTLVVLGMAARWASRESVADRVLVRLLMGALALFSLVIVASALYRMHLYEQAYGFTRLRVLVSVCELWLGAVFVMVLAAGVRLRGSWVPRALVATAVAALIGLVALNPDRFIAERNVDRYASTGRIDIWYLNSLSPDIVPALDGLPPQLRACALEFIAADLSRERDGWQEWNLGRAQARAALAAHPIEACRNIR